MPLLFPRKRAGSGWERHFCVGLLLVVFTSCQRTLDSRESESVGDDTTRHAYAMMDTATYVDDNSCGECHADIADSYRQVGMSRSFYPFDADTAIEDFSSGDFYHAASDRHYEMRVVDQQMVVRRFRLGADNEREYERQETVDYVMGSGNHVRSYFYRRDSGEMFEMPVAWYSQQQRWGMSPGYDHREHEGFDRPVTRQCMFCHNAYPDAGLSDDTYGTPHLFPKDLPHGIGCQRCHGPGSAHVAAAESDDGLSNNGGADDDSDVLRHTILNPARLETGAQEQVCWQCHLQPMSRRTSLVRRIGRGDYSYRPHQPLGSYLAVLELDENVAASDRFDINHHPYRLRQSACYQQGGLQCTTCHDPHRVVASVDRLNHYRQACFTCHGPQDCLDTAGKADDANCISCHMPKRRTDDVVHVTMTDHKIVRRANPDLLQEKSEGEMDHRLPLRNYESQAAEDDASLYRLLAGARDYNPNAIGALMNQVRRDPTADVRVLAELGEALLQTSKFDEAISILTRARQRAPQLAVVRSNLGAAWIGKRNYKSAIVELEAAIALEPRRAETHFNLGVALARLGQDSEAIQHYRQALALRSNYAKCRHNLGNALARLGRLQEAETEFIGALRTNPDYEPAEKSLQAVRRDLQERTGS